MSFQKPSYSVDEHDGFIRLLLLLSDPLSFDVTIKVLTTDGSATGELWSDCICDYMMCNGAGGDIDDGSGSGSGSAMPDSHFGNPL